MAVLQLDIPNLNSSTPVSPGIKEGTLLDWLSSLHMTDVEKSARSVISSIEQHNQSGMDPVQRVQVMNLFVPVITQLVEALRDKLKGSAFPLSKKNIKYAELKEQIMQGMANGFKIAVLDLDAGQGNTEKSSTALLIATYASIKYMAEQLLSAWLVYYPEPQGIWTQIHRLYRYAEETGIHDKVQPVQAGEKVTTNTIQHLYKRIVLLAISNPYHLMEGEASAILEYLNDWAKKCSITPHQENAVVSGQFYVDLAGEEPPCFASGGAEHTPEHGRIINVDALAGGLTSLIHKISEQYKDKDMSLKDRMNRDMLIRLHNAWGGRADRQEQRSIDKESILLSTGLGACHYFMSGRKEFIPEKDEIITRLDSQTEAGLSLMPLDDAEWKQRELQDRIEAGISQHRVSRFDDKGLDTWEKINATRAYHQSITGDIDSKYTITLLNKFNESVGGLGLTSQDLAGIKARVGELVIFRTDGSNDWQLGALRWLNNKDNQVLDLGIKTMSDNVNAVGVRAISGVGKGSEYFRALTCAEEVNGQKVQTIIVPANIFDSRSGMVLNHDGEIKYIRLGKILDTTSSYSQFHFEFINKPERNPYLDKYTQ